ncbi:hypothetical protein FIBSPDRAFT_357117 [Athelia psychrophila]|uniref:Uncharacterized protein n=1 Tax=Athelia psychrophila TaxID=1759441 RepID=A0A166PI06_9AGAM|nr:hypothetical protein FIBSPDRAFT_357117 [Fibularhizoctonia sp. CBS 109695]
MSGSLRSPILRPPALRAVRLSSVDGLQQLQIRIIHLAIAILAFPICVLRPDDHARNHLIGIGIHRVPDSSIHLHLVRVRIGILDIRLGVAICISVVDIHGHPHRSRRLDRRERRPPRRRVRRMPVPMPIPVCTPVPIPVPVPVRRRRRRARPPRVRLHVPLLVQRRDRGHVAALPVALALAVAAVVAVRRRGAQQLRAPRAEGAAARGGVRGERVVAVQFVLRVRALRLLGRVRGADGGLRLRLLRLEGPAAFDALHFLPAPEREYRVSVVHSNISKIKMHKEERKARKRPSGNSANQTEHAQN